jgi:glutamine synthetase type III
MNNLEVEIAELQKMIEAKRDELEKEGGIIEEKDLVRQSVKEMFLDSITPKTNIATTTPSSVPTASSQTVPANASYLDYLDPQTTEVINQLISQISSKGVTPVIDEVAGQEPFIIDAFHDALVDKLYEELKERGFVK